MTSADKDVKCACMQINSPKSAECNEEIGKLKTGFFLANLHPVRGWEIK